MKPVLISVAFAAIIAVVNVIVYQAIGWPVEPILALAYLYMIGLSVLFHRFIKADGDPKKFVNAYMAFSGGRMFLSLFVILIFALTNKAYLKPFTVAFLFLYFGFTFLEIARLWGQLKK